MRFKGIHLSKLGQKSSQNQVDYTCKNVSFFFFFGGDILWVRGHAASEKPQRVPGMNQLYSLYLTR